MENIYNVKELADKVLGSLRDNTSNMSTGFESVDRLTKGLKPGQLYIVGARPAMGKTAFVLNIIKHLILDEKKKVVLFSPGLHREKLMERLLAVTAQVGIKYNTDIEGRYLTYGKEPCSWCYRVLFVCMFWYGRVIISKKRR